MTETKAIYTSILEVQKGLANVPKNGEMKFGATSYKYLKADDVQEALNPLLSSNNIVVNAQYTTRDVEKGNRQWVYVDLDLTYISALDGSEFPVVKATGESIAGDDKSVNKALTQAIKNAHRATFQFASGEPEPDMLPPGAAPATTNAPAKSPTAAKLDKARTPVAKKPDSDDNQAKVRTWIGSDDERKTQANAAYERIKATGKTGAALWAEVAKEVLPSD